MVKKVEGKQLNLTNKNSVFYILDLNQVMNNQFANCPLDKAINQHFQVQLTQLNIHPQTEEDKQQLMKILNFYLCYPDDELANHHRNANRLGILDLTSEERVKMVDSQQLSDDFKRNIRQTKALKIRSNTCKCCGFIVQESSIDACGTQLKDVINLGTATNIFFKTFFNLIKLLIAMTVIYSVFSFASNVSVAKTSNYLNSTNSTLDYLSISLGSKSRHNHIKNQDGEMYYYISSWLGVLMLILWWLMFTFFKVQIAKIENDDRRRLGVSDFSIVIENMPLDITLQEIEKQFNLYLQRLRQEHNDITLQDIKVVKYNEGKPFYFNQNQFADDELKGILESYNQTKEKIACYAQEYMNNQKFTTNQVQRRLTYSKLQQLHQKRQVKYQSITSKIKMKMNNTQEIGTTVVFITFLTYEMRQFMLYHNKNSIFYKLKRLIQCWKISNYFSVQKDNIIYNDIKILAPPEPQDINWGNLGVSFGQKLLRKSFTILTTVVMIGICFVIVYFLSKVQNDNHTRFISFLISLAVSITNLLIIKVIQYTTVFEKEYSMNNFQISIAIKSVLAQLVNSIFVPLMTNYYIKSHDIFGASGLVEDIFILGITSSLVPPIVRIIDPYNIFIVLRYKCNQDESKKLRMNQFEFNEISQKMEFQIGMEYIYIISNFLFICFFVSLQPIISVFAIIGFIAMYWAQKYVLFKRCQRPPKGADFISSTMYQVIFCGPIFFSLGNLTWCYFLPDESFRGSIKENIYCLILSALMAFLSSDDLYDFCFPRPELNQSKTYYQKRIYFHAEYDRLNPSTNKEGVEQYLKFLSQKKREMELQANSQQNEQIFRELANNTHRNLCKGKKFLQSQENYTLEQIFNNQNKNATNPFLLLNGNLKNSEQITSLNQINLRPIENFIPTKKFNYQEVQEALPSSKVLLNTYNLDILDNQPQKFSNAFRTSFDIDDIDEFQRDDKAIEQIEPRLDANNQPL